MIVSGAGTFKCGFDYPPLVVEDDWIGMLGVGRQIGQFHLGLFLQAFGICLGVGRTPLPVKPLPLAGRLGLRR